MFIKEKVAYNSIISRYYNSINYVVEYSSSKLILYYISIDSCYQVRCGTAMININRGYGGGLAECPLKERPLRYF